MTAQKHLQVYGTQLLFADHATDFGAAPATAANSLIIGTPTNVQMNLSVVADDAAWESAKTATLADTDDAMPIRWIFGACIEGAATPTLNATYDFYWNASPNATAGTGNSGGCSGTDSSFTVGGETQLIRIGSLRCLAQTVNISSNIGTIWMPHLYGSLVMMNKSGAGMPADSVVDQTHITATPVIRSTQAPA